MSVSQRIRRTSPLANNMCAFLLLTDFQSENQSITETEDGLKSI